MSKIKTKGKVRLRNGLAYVEYLAVQDEANKLFVIGHKIKYVYDELIHQGLITMSYQSFYRYVKRYRNGIKESKKEPLIATQLEIFEQQEVLIAETKFNNLAEKTQKEKNSLDLVTINKDEDFFK